MSEQIKCSDGSDRFDNISFSNVIIDGKGLPLFSTYICPVCDEKIGFTKKDFEERALKKFSNLSKEHQILFDKFAQEKEFNKLHFLDWYCPKCKSPARAYVNYWVGGRHGDYGVNIVFVLEKLNENFDNSQQIKSSWLSDTIKVYFYFLSEFGFKGPFEYQIAYEMHVFYVKGNIIIDFGYDDGYSCSIIQTNEHFKKLETGESNPAIIGQGLLKSYDLSLLYNEHLPILFQSHNISFYKKFREPKQQIQELLKLLKNNLELLNGVFKKYSIWYRIKNKFNKSTT